MSWYARYKPIVDPFLSAFMWLVFSWRIFTQLPNIINGVGSAYTDYEGIKLDTKPKNNIGFRG